MSAMGLTQTSVVATADGWRLQLRRLAAKQPTHPTPLLMLHGFGANAFCLANQAGPSLGHFLARRGFDVWLLDFRGTRTSKHPDDEAAFQRIAVDQKILFDVPAAVDRVLDETGRDALDLVGFSLGGTITYAYLSHFGQSSVRRVVTLAAPLRFDLPRSLQLLQRLERAPLTRRVVPRRIPLGGFTRLGARTNIVLPAHDHFNLANVERPVLLEMMRHGSEDASTAELLQLLDWSARRRLCSVDERIDFTARIDRIDRPALLIGAAADHHVRPDALVSVLATLASRDKRLVLIGRDTGARLDYGHTDLLLGTRAEVDVFPHVESWLGAGQPSLPPDGGA